MTEVYTISSDSETDEPKVICPIIPKQIFEGNVEYPITIESEQPNFMFEYVFGKIKIRPLTTIPQNVPSKQGKYLYVIKPSPEYEVETTRCDVLTPWGAPGIRPKISNYVIKMDDHGFLKASTIRANLIPTTTGIIGQMYYCRHAIYNGIKKKIFYCLNGRKFNPETLIVIVYIIDQDQNYLIQDKPFRNSIKLKKIISETTNNYNQSLTEVNHFLDDDDLEISTNQQMLEQTIENIMVNTSLMNDDMDMENTNDTTTTTTSPKSMIDDYQKLYDESKMLRIFEDIPNESYISMDENQQIHNIEISSDGKSVSCDCINKVSTICSHLFKLKEVFPNLKIWDHSKKSTLPRNEPEIQIPVSTMETAVKRPRLSDSVPEIETKKMFCSESPSIMPRGNIQTESVVRVQSAVKHPRLSDSIPEIETKKISESPNSMPRGNIQTESAVRGVINRALKEYYVQHAKLELYFNDYPFYLIKTTPELKTKECVRCCRQITDDYVFTHFEITQSEQTVDSNGYATQLICPTFSCFFIRYPYVTPECIINNVPEKIAQEVISKILF